jgi:poly-D-alanine transfer protein DltD
MNLEKIIKSIGTMCAKILLNKKEGSSEIIQLDKMNSTDIIPILLKRLTYEGNYNKAENILFEEISKNKTDKMFQIAMDFYNLLLQQNDEKLKNGNFSREEVYQGIKDIKLLMNR